MIKIYFFKIFNNNFTEDDYKIYNTLSIERKNKIDKRNTDINKKICLYSDIILRHFLCKETHLKNSDLLFLKNEFGKPYLSNFTNIKYNISHTKDALLIGISDKEIGVDIEKKRNINIRIAKRFFTENEYKYILEKNSSNRFLEVWTRKEAYAKFVGKGLSIGLNSFDTIKRSYLNKIHTIYLSDYIISICAEQRFYNNIHIIDKEEMISILELY